MSSLGQPGEESQSHEPSQPAAMSFRDRALRYYQVYAPENIGKVDSALERYAGQEEKLFEDLKMKYGQPEPSDDQVRLASVVAPSSSSQASGSNQNKTPASPISSPQMRRVASTPSGDSGTRRPSMASPRNRQGSLASTTSPMGRAKSFSGGSPHAPSPQFGDVQVSDGDEDDDSSGIRGPGAHPNTSASVSGGPVDPYTSMRSRITNDVGFSDPILKRIWEDAWLGKIPYGNLIKTWGDSVIHSGYGWKLTNASTVQRWQKRFFVLVPHFLYYFDSDDAKAACKGAVYLERAKVKEQEAKERRSIVITPRVHKKPLELVADGDFSSFTLNFEPKKVQDGWLDLLHSMVKIVPPAPNSSSSVQGGPAASPAVLLKTAQSNLGAIRSAGSFAASSVESPMRFDRTSSGDVHHQTPNSNTQFPADSLGAFGNVGLTPREAAVLAAYDAATPSAALPPLPMDSNNYRSPASANSLPQSLGLPPATAGPSTPYINNPPHPQAREDERSRSSSDLLLAQQQKLHHMLVAAQQQQNDLLFRSQLQQEVVKARQTLHVDESDLKRRIGRIADDREAPALAEALLSFVMDNVTDLNALWKLMSALDDLPRKSASSLQHPSHMGHGGSAMDHHGHLRSTPPFDNMTTPRSSPLPPAHPPAHPSHQPLTYDHVSNLIAADQHHYREEASAMQRQRILENDELVARYHQHHMVPDAAAADSTHRHPRNVGGGDRAYTPSPHHSSQNPNHLFSPSPTSWPTTAAAGRGGAAGVGSEDYAWQERLARMKQRKRAVEGLLNDLP